VLDRLNGRVGLAILPLEPGSTDAETRVLASGLTEDITTELSRFREIAVLARGRSAEFLAEPGQLTAKNERVEARLVLCGSVRTASGRARITAALTDTTTGLELWRERWDVSLDDPFRVIDRMTRSIVGALSLRIDEARLGRARERPAERLEVYECWLRGLECLRRGTPESDHEAREFFTRALELSPRFARGYAGISLSHFNDWSCQAWERWDERERLSFENARRAVELDENDHVTHTILARIHVYRREFELGERHLQHALSLNSNDPNMLIHSALAYAQLGEARRACELADDALALNPLAPDWYYPMAAFAHFVARNPQQALRLALRAPDAFVDTRALLAAAAAQLADDVGARGHALGFVTHFRRKIVTERPIEPSEPIAWLLRVSPFKRAEDTDYLLDGLRRAGLGQ
jgi:TolB-like protein